MLLSIVSLKKKASDVMVSCMLLSIVSVKKKASDVMVGSLPGSFPSNIWQLHAVVYSFGEKESILTSCANF